MTGKEFDAYLLLEHASAAVGVFGINGDNTTEPVVSMSGICSSVSSYSMDNTDAFDALQETLQRGER